MDSFDKHGYGAGNIGDLTFWNHEEPGFDVGKKARNGFDHFVYSWNLGGKTGRNMFAFVGEALPIGIFFDLLSPRLLGNSISDGIWPTILHE